MLMFSPRATSTTRLLDPMRRAKILIVDDEADILDMLAYNLQNEGYDVHQAQSGQEALRQVQLHKPELILLDIMMPEMDGVETCRRIRELPEGNQFLILFLTARSEEYSELAGFEAGGDDYITKPIRPRILVSRVKAALRRGDISESANTSRTLKVADLQIVKDEYLVYRGELPISLPKKEFELLYFLAARPGKVFSRDVLLKNIWGTEVYVVPRTIDVHIRKLREKIGEHYIQTVKGVGYKFLS